MTTNAFHRDPQRVSPKRKRGIDYILILIGAAMLILPLLLITGERNEVTDTRYLISDLRAENAYLREVQMKLRAELNHLARPNRVFEQALTMGLVPVIPANRVEVLVEVPDVLPEETPPSSLVATLDEEP